MSGLLPKWVIDPPIWSYLRTRTSSTRSDFSNENQNTFSMYNWTLRFQIEINEPHISHRGLQGIWPTLQKLNTSFRWDILFTESQTDITLVCNISRRSRPHPAWKKQSTDGVIWLASFVVVDAPSLWSQPFRVCKHFGRANIDWVI